ncbi:MULTISPECIES: hypothetical protein [unclassified Microbacterium]|uniref:hypothetical protein n=1 Tax=unclassified Microbacterium TaxID=2609290 RepID=UPI003445B21A
MLARTADLWLHDDMSVTRGGRQGRMRVPTAVALMTATALLICGCAVAAPGAGASASPMPTAACPQVEGIDLPPECAPYDPEHSMAQNDRHRERMEMPEGAQAAADDAASQLRTSLESIRSSGAISAEAVEDAARDAGLSDITARGDSGAVEFGAAAPDGGCVFGGVNADAVRVEVGGYILDGGCLPAQ